MGTIARTRTVTASSTTARVSSMKAAPTTSLPKKTSLVSKNKSKRTRIGGTDTEIGTAPDRIGSRTRIQTCIPTLHSYISRSKRREIDKKTKSLYLESKQY